MTDVSKLARSAVIIGLALLLGACAAPGAQVYDPYQPPPAVTEQVYEAPPRVAYLPRPFGSSYGYYDAFPYPYRPTLAATVFGGGFGPVFRDRRYHRDTRKRDERRRARNRGDDRAKQSRAEPREPRTERRANRRDASATNAEERRLRRKLRRKLRRERRAARRERASEAE